MLVNQLKFPQFFERVKDTGHPRVFPKLSKTNNKYSHEFSKSFGRYLRKKAMIIDKKKVFHSFRHNVTDHLYKKVVSETLIEELMGRAGKTETSKRYGKGYRVETLYKEAVKKLKYEIDLSHLKNSKYVIK